MESILGFALFAIIIATIWFFCWFAKRDNNIDSKIALYRNNKLLGYGCIVKKYAQEKGQGEIEIDRIEIELRNGTNYIIRAEDDSYRIRKI